MHVVAEKADFRFPGAGPRRNRIIAMFLNMIFTWNEFLFALVLSFEKAQTILLLIAPRAT